jgi:hypothetical protein
MTLEQTVQKALDDLKAPSAREVEAYAILKDLGYEWDKSIERWSYSFAGNPWDHVRTQVEGLTGVATPAEIQAAVDGVAVAVAVADAFERENRGGILRQIVAASAQYPSQYIGPGAGRQSFFSAAASGTSGTAGAQMTSRTIDEMFDAMRSSIRAPSNAEIRRQVEGLGIAQTPPPAPPGERFTATQLLELQERGRAIRQEMLQGLAQVPRTPTST